MAIKCAASPNNSQTKTALTELIFQDVRRLSTFSSKIEAIHRTLTKGLLAKLGFYHVGIGNIVKCEGCGFETELSVSDKDLFEGHMKESPECQFVLKQKDIATNHQLTSFSISNNLPTNNFHSNFQSNINLNVNSLLNNTDPQRFFLDSLSDETCDKLREYTFVNWPLITPNIKDMVAAGWAYTNIADRVICIYCDVLFHKWTESDRPYEIHRLKSSNCRFVQSAEQKPRESSSSNIPIITDPTTRAAVDAVNANYVLATRRYESFQTWPHTEKDPLPSVESFVDAGFFYIGEKTVVRCFYCNGALRNWQATDDPKVEHARWYPHCAYIRQYVGEDLYEAIQRKNRELKALENCQNNLNGQNSQIVPWTDDEIERMTKARLDLPIVEKLRQAGFSMAIIRKTYEMQLKFKKDDFKTDNDLRLACFILNRQVKLINGNESVLLVPHDWLKKYIEDQAQGVQQVETKQSQIVQSQVNNIETPKIVAPIAPRPQMMQKLDKQPMLCVLCLTTECQVACLPCGHLSSCVACGHSLKTCPICRATVKAFVRIYM